MDTGGVVAGEGPLGRGRELHPAIIAVDGPRRADHRGDARGYVRRLGGGVRLLHYSRAMAGFEVTERIGAAGRRLTASERRVAQVILERPQLVAFGTVADLAGQAGAGAATVVRLAGKLGFDGFSALQSSVRRDLSHQLRPAVERIRELEGTRTSERHRAAMQCNVQATLDGVDHADLDKAVELLADLTHPVAVLAGDAQHGVALQFVHDLGALRPGVEALWGPDVAVQRQIATSTPGSTLVVIDLRRYERWLLDAAKAAQRAGHAVIALVGRAAVAARHGCAGVVHASRRVGVAVREPGRHDRPARAARGRGGRTVEGHGRGPTGERGVDVGAGPLAGRRVSEHEGQPSMKAVSTSTRH